MTNEEWNALRSEATERFNAIREESFGYDVEPAPRGLTLTRKVVFLSAVIAIAAVGTALGLTLTGGSKFDPLSEIGKPSWQASYDLRVHGYTSVMGYEPAADWDNGSEVVVTEACGSNGVTVKAVYTGQTPSGRKLPEHTALLDVNADPAATLEMFQRYLAGTNEPDSVCQSAIQGADSEGSARR
jgi:hypothetical protein